MFSHRPACYSINSTSKFAGMNFSEYPRQATDNTDKRVIKQYIACRILDPEKFYRYLRYDIQEGFNNPRFQTGALASDLSKLRGFVATVG